MRLFHRALAIEENSTGKANKEIEYVFYGKIINFTDLNKASSKEHHSQWEVRIPETNLNAGKGTIRVRKTIPNITDVDKTEYVHTTKVSTKDKLKRIEVSIPTTVDNFNQMLILSERGLVKDRYFFPVKGTDLVFEFDVFYSPGAIVGSGKYIEWCKIDIEVNDSQTIIPELPIDVSDLIIAQEGNRTIEEDNLINSLYANEFNSKNVFL